MTYTQKLLEQNIEKEKKLVSQMIEFKKKNLKLKRT